MEQYFLKIVNMSITAGWLVLAVIALRLLLKNIPKYFRVILWGLVGLRLIFPFSFESIFSLIPSAQPLPETFLYSATPQVDTSIQILNQAVNPILENSLTPEPWASANPSQIWSFLLSRIWIAGVGLMLLHALISYLQVRKTVSVSVKAGPGLRLCDRIDSPFILGVFRPVIYVPGHMDQNTLSMVLAHENAHIQRNDHWWKPLGYLQLCIHWFNPLIWIGYILLCRDIELACDEKVIAELGADAKKEYSFALLECSINRKVIAACPLAFGEVGVKDRVNSVLHYKKPAFWLIVTGILVCFIVAVCFLTDPVVKVDPLTLENWGITITAQDPSPTGVTLTIHIPDNLDGKITIPSNQTLLQLKDGEWVDVPPIVKESDIVWDFIKFLYPDYTATYQRVEWERYYGILEPGEYRITKPLWLHLDEGVSYTKDFIVEFVISPDSNINVANLTDLIVSLADRPSISLALNQEKEFISGINPWGCLNDIQTVLYLQELNFQPILYPEFKSTLHEIRMEFTEQPDGPELWFYEGSDDLILSHNGSKTYYRASYEYASIPIGTQMRNWFDEAELAAKRQEILSLLIETGEDPLTAASEFCGNYFDIHTKVASGSMYRYNFVTCQVQIDEEITEIGRENGWLPENSYAFSVTVIFVPDNDRALTQAMPGNTGTYTDSDPNIPADALQYFRCGYIQLTGDGWLGQIVGTGW